MLRVGTAQLGRVVGRWYQLDRRVACSPEGLMENFVHLFTFSDVSTTGIFINFYLTVFKDVSCECLIFQIVAILAV
jgi:hypothetical protein